MAQPQPFHTPPYNFAGALPPQLVQYWFDFIKPFEEPHPIRTVFDDETNQLIPLDPPMVNGPRIVPAPFNGPFPIKTLNPKTGRLNKEIGVGVFVGFLLIGGDDDTLAWHPKNWCAVYGKMGKHPGNNWSRKGAQPKRKCTFSAKNRNFLAADTVLEVKARTIAFQRIHLIKQLRGLSRAEVEAYVASGEARARKDGMHEYSTQMLHLRSLQNAHLGSLALLPSTNRLAAQYNR